MDTKSKRHGDSNPATEQTKPCYSARRRPTNLPPLDTRSTHRLKKHSNPTEPQRAPSGSLEDRRALRHDSRERRRHPATAPPKRLPRRRRRAAEPDARGKRALASLRLRPEPAYAPTALRPVPPPLSPPRLVAALTRLPPLRAPPFPSPKGGACKYPPRDQYRAGYANPIWPAGVLGRRSPGCYRPAQPKALNAASRASSDSAFPQRNKPRAARRPAAGRLCYPALASRPDRVCSAREVKRGYAALKASGRRLRRLPPNHPPASVPQTARASLRAPPCLTSPVRPPTVAPVGARTRRPALKRPSPNTGLSLPRHPWLSRHPAGHGAPVATLPGLPRRRRVKVAPGAPGPIAAKAPRSAPTRQRPRAPRARKPRPTPAQPVPRLAPNSRLVAKYPAPPGY